MAVTAAQAVFMFLNLPRAGSVDEEAFKHARDLQVGRLSELIKSTQLSREDGLLMINLLMENKVHLGQKFHTQLYTLTNERVGCFEPPRGPSQQ